MTALAPSPAEQLRAAQSAFLTRFDAYVTGSRRKPGGVSADLFGSTRKVEKLRDGAASVTIDVLAQADEKLAELAREAGVTLPSGFSEAESGPGVPAVRRGGEAS